MHLERDFLGLLEICSEEEIGHCRALWCHLSSDLKKCACIRVSIMSGTGMAPQCVHLVGFWLAHLSGHTALALTVPYG